jgi:16S rRNA (uracil1498-N3)-methyltransferase
MPAGHFLVLDTPLAAGAELELPAEVAHQARDVLRLASGDTITLLDGAGGAYPAELLAVARQRVVARLGARQEATGAEPAVRVVLCQGMLKATKFETVLQKCTELGVAAFVPLLGERTVAASDELSAAKRRRWRAILAEAVEQCGGARLPELASPLALLDALAGMPPGGTALFAWEEARGASLRAALESAVATAGGVAQMREVRLFVGPEGGFAPDEAALAERHGARLVTLGPRILRAETAAIVASALTLDALRATSGWGNSQDLDLLRA